MLYLGRDDTPPYLVTAASSGEIFITSLDTAYDTDEYAISEVLLSEEDEEEDDIDIGIEDYLEEE